MNNQISAQDLYERYERHHDRNGVTVRSWIELSDIDKEAWEAVARFVYSRTHGAARNAGKEPGE